MPSVDQFIHPTQPHPLCSHRPTHPSIYIPPIHPKQLAGAHPDMLSRCTELLVKEDVRVDFIDLNLGCPIELINNQGACLRAYARVCGVGAMYVRT